jgi:catechol 2,3-dioxygenase-like lactoylglutathione lyase family enzyme
MIADEHAIGAFVDGVGGNVNVNVRAGTPSLETLRRLNVARVSMGGGLFRIAMNAVRTQQKRCSPAHCLSRKGEAMAIQLNHTIVPAKDKEASARFFADIFGLRYDGAQGHFAPVRINGDLTLDFDYSDQFDRHHYAFLIGDEDFDAIYARVRAAGILYGSGPREPDNMQINTRRDGRGFYFSDPNGHLLEVMTRA